MEKTETMLARFWHFGYKSLRAPNSIHIIATTETKSASPGFLIGLFAVTVLSVSGSAVLGQMTTQISGTFAPSFWGLLKRWARWKKENWPT